MGAAGRKQESSPKGATGGGHDGAVLEQDVDAAPPALPRREVQRRRPGVVPHVHEAREPPAPPQLRTHKQGAQQSGGETVVSPGATKAYQDSDTGADLAAERMVRRQSAWP